MKTSSFSQNKPLNYLLVFSVIFIWGITFVCTKYLLRSFSPYEILFVRFIAAYAMLWLLNPKKLVLANKSDELWFVLAGLSGVTVYQFLENVAINFTLPANVSIIVSICPMFTAIIAEIFLKEKHINILFVAGFVTAIIGIALVSFNGAIVFHLSPKGDILALGAALCWGFYSLSVSKINNLKLNPIQATRRAFFWAVIAMLPIGVYGLLKGDSSSVAFVNLDVNTNIRRWSDIYNWINLAFLGIGASAFAFVVWNYVCRNLGTVKVSVYIYLIPVVTIVFAFVVLGDTTTLMGMAGVVLTIFGLFLSDRSKKKTNSSICKKFKENT